MAPDQEAAEEFQVQCRRLTSEETSMSDRANVGKFYHPFMKKNYSEPPPSSLTIKKLLYQAALPPTKEVNVGLCISLAVCTTYGIFLSIFRTSALPYSEETEISDESSARYRNLTNCTSDLAKSTTVISSDGNIFALFLLLVLCLLAGGLAKLLHLPPLLGMLLMGICLRNIPCVDFAKYILPKWASVLRKMAFVVILIQGGLGLDFHALRRLKAACLRLAFTPCICEAVIVMLAARFILGMPWVFGLMLGFVLGAVSPAICVPSMLSLQEKGFGVNQGIPTLVMAASSTDDVLAITAFSVLLSIAFASGEIWLIILRGPLDVVIGIVYGVLVGIIVQYTPDLNSKYRELFRVLLLLNFGLLAMFGSAALRVDGAGALGCLISAFLANYGWKKEDMSDGQLDVVNKSFSVLWFIFQPFLFGLIGAELDLRNELKPEFIGLGFGVLVLGLAVRTVAAALAVLGCGLKIKEQIFVALAWLPKATVQAALGPVVYDTAHELGKGEKYSAIGIQILTVAVLGILLTAPLGAVLISLTGPLLLRQQTESDSIKLSEETKDRDGQECETGLL